MNDKYELRCKIRLSSRRPLFLVDVTPAGNDLKAAKRGFVRLSEYCRLGSDLLRVELWNLDTGLPMRWVDVADEQTFRVVVPG